MNDPANKKWYDNWWIMLIINALIFVFMIYAIGVLKQPYQGDPSASSQGQEEFPRW